MGNKVTVHEVKQTDSTNTLAKKLALEGAKNLTLVWAHRQTAGRGRYGRDWVSPTGNVFWSMILRPLPNWPKLSGLSHVAALAVHATISQFVNEKNNVQIKWPNDVLVNGKKISGILLEANCSTDHTRELATTSLINGWVVVGIGVNVMHYPENVNYPATSLCAEGILSCDRDMIIAALTEHFIAQLTAYIAHGSLYLREQLLPRMAGLGNKINVRISDNPEDDIAGVCSGLSDEGGLIVLTNDGELRIVSSGEVFFGSKHW